jgi:hypothetical protein
MGTWFKWAIQKANKIFQGSMNKPFSLEKLDAVNKKTLAPVLADHVWLLDKAWNTIALTLQCSGPLPRNCGHAEALCINLLTRIQNELTAMKLVCGAGYSLQAFSIGSVIYELSWLITAVGNTDTNAKEWFQHNSDLQFGKIRALTEMGLRNLEGSDTNANDHYANYKQLCLGKHANPRLQQTQGFEISTDPASELDLQTFRAGSACNRNEVAKSWWLIGLSVSLVENALIAFIRYHIGDVTRIEQASATVAALKQSATEISEQAIQVWQQNQIAND